MAMHGRLTRALAAGALALLSTAARADEGPAKGDDARALTHGVELKGKLSTDAKSDKRIARFRFSVPSNAIMARVDVEGCADVDLFVARKPIDDLEAWAERTESAVREEREGGGRRGRRAREADEDGKDPLLEKRLSGAILLDDSSGETGTERVALHRGSGALKAGDHHVAIAFQHEEPPLSSKGEPVESIDFKVKLLLVTARIDGKLEAGKPADGVVEPDLGAFRTFTIEVPATAKALRFDLTDAPQDLNLRARKGAPILDEADIEEEAATGVGTENLVIEPEEEGGLAGTWYVDVVDAHELDFATPFKLRASFSKEPDPAILALPKPPVTRTPVERAAAGVIEILSVEGGGGSGVLISEKGFAITNYHVVQEAAERNGAVGEPMIVAVTLDPRDVARESFRAKIIAVDSAQDLALIRCETGLYGQPIPADYKFPTVPLGAADKLTIGDPLLAVGYPAVGGTGSRAAITFSRGILSGFERRGTTLHFKTDAMISPGNSGGGVVNDRYELVGFATETLSDDETNGVLGFVRPTWLVPADWWAKAGVTPPKSAAK